MENKATLMAISFSLVILFSAGIKAQSVDIGNENLIIYEVSPYPFPGERMEYVCIINAGTARVNLSNYFLTDFEGYLHLHGYLLPYKKYYVAQNATEFRKIMGFSPDATYSSAHYNGTFSLANKGDEVALIKNCKIVDIVIYGKSSYSGYGWYGKSVDIKRGRILRRKGLQDTNTSTDWSNYHSIGQSDFKGISVKTNLEIFVYPDDRNEVLRFINGTEKYLYIEVYELSDFRMESALVHLLKRGVSVYVMMEGNPVGGIDVSEKYCVEDLWKNGAKIYFMINAPLEHIYDRYRFVHSKYIIRDGKEVLISTENFVKSAMEPCGNRGYGVIIKNPRFAQYLSKVFVDDIKNVSDVENYNGEYRNVSLIMDKKFELREPVFRSINLTAEISLVLSPDNSVEMFDKFVRSQRKLDVEALYLKGYPYSKVKNITDRILVEKSYGTDMKEFYGRDKNISYLHAKLMIGTTAVFLGSMNFANTSLFDNREVSVIIRSRQAVNFFEKVFDYDWKKHDDIVSFAKISEDETGLKIKICANEKIRYVKVYLDGKNVYSGKYDENRGIRIKTGEGTHELKIYVYGENSMDVINAAVNIRQNFEIPSSALFIPVAVAVFLYKLWKRHRRVV